MIARTTRPNIGLFALILSAFFYADFKYVHNIEQFWYFLKFFWKTVSHGVESVKLDLYGELVDGFDNGWKLLDIHIDVSPNWE